VKTICFVVYGVAQPAGSKRSFAIKKGGSFTGSVSIADANPKSKGWKQQVAQEAGKTMRELSEIPFAREIAIRAKFSFSMPRPQAHYKKNGTLKPWALIAKPIVKPDALKLARAVEDACSKIIYQDDAQITTEHLYKRYVEANAPSVTVEFTEDTD
jgi:Holliday junction resolvase RusA-like endonuclease